MKTKTTYGINVEGLKNKEFATIQEAAEYLGSYSFEDGELETGNELPYVQCQTVGDLLLNGRVVGYYVVELVVEESV